MTLRTRINLECDSCADAYPCVGLCPAPLDGALFTASDLRREAKEQGWTAQSQRNSGFLVRRDLCARCSKKEEKASK